MAITIQVVGTKNTGKTLVITHLIRRLVNEGYRVAAIKHDAHSSSMDVPGTDSFKMSTAGARQVVLESNNQVFFHQQGHRPSLKAIVSFLAAQNDVVIIEGHKAVHYPRILLLDTSSAVDDVSDPSLIIAECIVRGGQVNTPALEKVLQIAMAYLKRQMGEAK